MTLPSVKGTVKRRPLCHRMSGFLFTKPSSLALDPNTAMPVFECVGTQCSLYVLDMDSSGHPTGNGLCGDTLLAVSMASVAQGVAAIAEEVCGGDDPDDDVEPTQSPAES